MQSKRQLARSPHRLDAHFERFSKDLELNPGRAERIKTAIKSVENFIASDGPLQQYVTGDLRPQGSYATELIVRPIYTQTDYDIDLLVPMNFRRFRTGRLHNGNRTPDYILKYLANRLRTNYTVRIEVKNADGLPVPATRTGEEAFAESLPCSGSRDDPKHPIRLVRQPIPVLDLKLPMSWRQV